MKNDKNIKIMSYMIVLLSISLIFGYVEAIFPFSIGSVGIKVGLCNIITLIGFYILNIKKTFCIGMFRVLIIGIIFANFIRFLLSLSGFLLSFVIMLILYKMKFSIIFTSIFGGIFHNVGQIIALSIISKNALIMRLLPIYVIVGIITGLIIGIITSLILKNKIFKIML